MNDVIRYRWLAVLAFGLAAMTGADAQTTQPDPLPAWNNGTRSGRSSRS